MTLSNDFGGIRSLRECCGRFLAEQFQKFIEESPEVLFNLDLDTFAAMLGSDELTSTDEKNVLNAILTVKYFFWREKEHPH